jgi:hypothetical protein
MRRITQLVSLMVALLLAGQTALADAPCAYWLSSSSNTSGCCAPAAGTSGRQLAAECHSPMHAASFIAGCSKCACNSTTGQVAAPPLASPDSKAYRVVALSAIAQLPALAPIAMPAESFQSASAPGRARHLLFHVFRI